MAAQQIVAKRDARIRELEELLALALRRNFGKKSEKRATGKLTPPRQPGKGPRRHGGGRKPLPSHLLRYRTEYGLDEADRHCPDCGDVMSEFGETVTEELEQIRLFLVHQIARKKYSCKHCQTKVLVADGPVRVLDKCMAGPSFLAMMLVQKFGDHLPLYRQERMLKRDGISITRATLCSWTSRCGQMLHPIAKEILRSILASPCVQTDDTGMLIQVVEGGEAKKGYVWTYTNRDDLVYFHLTTSHGHEAPLAILREYEGYVQADAHASYNALFRIGKAKEAGCMAHARRKFVEAIESDEIRSNQVVALIGRLYDIEREAKQLGLEPDRVRLLREEHSTPTLAEIKRLIDPWNPELDPPAVLPKSPLGGAVTYALNQWDALCRYTEDGRLDIDNNRSERMLRHVAIGRKNYLSVGNEVTGQEAANIISVVMTCRAVGIDPQTYLTQTLQDLARWDGSDERLAEMTPMAWKRRGDVATIAEAQRQRIVEILSAIAAEQARPRADTS